MLFAIYEASFHVGLTGFWAYRILGLQDFGLTGFWAYRVLGFQAYHLTGFRAYRQCFRFVRHCFRFFLAIASDLFGIVSDLPSIVSDLLGVGAICEASFHVGLTGFWAYRILGLQGFGLTGLPPDRILTL